MLRKNHNIDIYFHVEQQMKNANDSAEQTCKQMAPQTSVDGRDSTIAFVVSNPSGPFQLKEVCVQDMRPDEILVRMVATGICHTDLASASGGLGPEMPAILGHEGAGVVKKVGALVTHVAVGEHVVLSIPSCGGCKQCQGGRPAYCRHAGELCFGGSRLDGSTTFSLGGGAHVSSPYFGQSSFAALSVVHGSCAVKISPTEPLDILCCLGCGIQTGAGTVLNVLKPAVGASIAVFGVGSVGLAAIIAAANFTPATKIIAIDILEARLQQASKMGATHTINSTEGDVVQMIKDITDGEGADFALDATGIISVIDTMLAAAANNGTVATVGGPPRGDFVKIEPATWILRGVSYVGSCQGSSVPRTVG